jgi:hypothetical protein
VKPRLRSWERRLLIVYRPLWTIDELVAHAQEVTSRRKLGAFSSTTSIASPRLQASRISEISRCRSSAGD